MKDIDRVIDQVKEALPDVRWSQLKVCNPGADDDGLWLFQLPNAAGEVQAESSNGMCPFTIETDKHDERTECRTIEDAVERIVDWLRMPGRR